MIITLTVQYLNMFMKEVTDCVNNKKKTLPFLRQLQFIHYYSVKVSYFMLSFYIWNGYEIDYPTWCNYNEFSFLDQHPRSVSVL